MVPLKSRPDLGNRRALAGHVGGQPGGRQAMPNTLPIEITLIIQALARLHQARDPGRRQLPEVKLGYWRAGLHLPKNLKQLKANLKRAYRAG